MVICHIDLRRVHGCSIYSIDLEEGVRYNIPKFADSTAWWHPGQRWKETGNIGRQSKWVSRWNGMWKEVRSSTFVDKQRFKTINPGEIDGVQRNLCD